MSQQVLDGVIQKIDIIWDNVAKIVVDRDEKERRLRQIKDLAYNVVNNPRERDAVGLAKQILSLIP
jgi:hypothetical protein